ncbi:MAG: glycosyltransferase family 39 protein, partial [Smithella sp.]
MGLPELSSEKSSRSEYLQKVYRFFSGDKVFDLSAILICAASFGCSMIESIVNNDNLHWGWAYIVALDLKRGAIPHSETIIFYGYVYSWIQSVALILFGERLMSVGIITGLFYSLTLFLSYLVFLRFLKKSLAFASVLLIFLIHPYIIYPAANYFAYTFQLLALLFFLRYSDHHLNGLLAGFFLSMSVLSRYSSVIAIIPPFVIMLCWEFFTIKSARKSVIKKITMVSCGFIVPSLIFFIYLAMNSALDDFFYQNKMLINIMGRPSDIYTWLGFLGSILQIVPGYASDFRGKLFTLILGVSLFIIIREGIRKLSGNTEKSKYARYDIMAVCLVTIFGYLNSIHVYETIRLVNGASLGVGLCALVYYDFSIRSGKSLKYLVVFLSILIFLFLSFSLFFTKTSSAYYPWRMDVLLHTGVTNKTIGMLKGKILTKEYNDFYQEVFDAIAPYKNSCYIINYTSDVVALSINDLPRIQIAPVHFPWMDDISKQAKLIDERKAVILCYKELKFPGYKEIFKKDWP